MAKVTVDLQAFDKMSDAAAEAGLRGALGKGEAILKADILNRPGTGRIYGKHQASAPGQPPAPDTGNLRSNTNADTELKRDGEDFVGTISANDTNAARLERGTERMAARPFLGLLATDYKDDLQRAFVEGARR